MILLTEVPFKEPTEIDPKTIKGLRRRANNHTVLLRTESPTHMEVYECFEDVCGKIAYDEEVNNK